MHSEGQTDGSVPQLADFSPQPATWERLQGHRGPEREVDPGQHNAVPSATKKNVIYRMLHLSIATQRDIDTR